jgi:hypothetical protein
MFVSCTVFVMSGRGLCDGPIPHPGESYRLWCVFECDQVKIKNPSTPTVNKYVAEGRTTKLDGGKVSALRPRHRSPIPIQQQASLAPQWARTFRKRWN